MLDMVYYLFECQVLSSEVRVSTHVLSTHNAHTHIKRWMFLWMNKIWQYLKIDEKVSFFSEYIMYHQQYFALLSSTKQGKIKYENENILIRIYIFNILGYEDVYDNGMI